MYAYTYNGSALFKGRISALPWICGLSNLFSTASTRANGEEPVSEKARAKIVLPFIFSLTGRFPLPFDTYEKYGLTLMIY